MYDCATPHTHRHADAVEEIGAWLGWLQSQGVAKVALLGHSRGGNQTARFAAAHADVPLTDAEIEDYYDEHESDFEQPARAEVRVVVVDKRDMVGILTGLDFARAAL